jgi:hypothetical protein
MLGAKIVWMTLMETRSVRRWAACESLGSISTQHSCWSHCTGLAQRAAPLYAQTCLVAQIQ